MSLPETHGRWPWGAAAMAGPATAAAWANRDELVKDGAWALWLPLPALFWHQTEEWVVPGGFLPWFNRTMAGSDADEFPITRRGGAVINLGLGWALGLAAGALGRRAPVLPATMLTTLLTNAAMHVGAGRRDGVYNPGLGTSVVLFVPIGVAGLVRLARDPEVPTRDIVRGLAAGIASSAVMFAVMRLRGRAQRST